jgi:hypothetical protein
MGISCGNMNNNSRRILELKSKYPYYHIDDPNIRSKESYRKELEESEVLLCEHARLFYKYKEELHKSNLDLYKRLFTEESDTVIEIKHLRAEDEIKFLFFFNKRNYRSLKMNECNIKFPRVNYLITLVFSSILSFILQSSFSS